MSEENIKQPENVTEGNITADTAKMIPLEERSLKQLQEYLGELGFVSPEVLGTKGACLAVIQNYQEKTASANKALEDAQKELDAVKKERDAVQTTTPDGKVLNPTAPAPADLAKEPVVAKEWAGKAAAMKARLESQPKVQFLIPLGFGEKRGSYDTVILNGFRLNIMKGVLTFIPKQVAEVLAESYQMTASAGEEFLMDRKDEVKEALG